MRPEDSTGTAARSSNTAVAARWRSPAPPAADGHKVRDSVRPQRFTTFFGNHVRPLAGRWGRGYCPHTCGVHHAEAMPHPGERGPWCVSGAGVMGYRGEDLDLRTPQ